MPGNRNLCPRKRANRCTLPAWTAPPDGSLRALLSAVHTELCEKLGIDPGPDRLG